MDYMERALSLARRALGNTSPNPPVGAVIVSDGLIVGEGWTQPPGQAHAEIVALGLAGPSAKGATMFTTLEPCCHTGRTPPCTQAIIQAGISEVHISIKDPNPLVNGRGIAELEAAGVKTYPGEGEEEALELTEAHSKFITTGRPFVTAKFAISLDGKIATRTGDSQWITGEEERIYVHQLRAASDAIMVGINTVLADDPRLTARLEEPVPAERQPLRVVVDSRGRTPPSAKLLREPGRTLIATNAPEAKLKGLKSQDVELVHLPSSDGSIDLVGLLELLGKRGIASLLVEGGGTLLGSFFDQRLVDKVIAVVSPVVIGGKEAPSPVGGMGAEAMAQALRLKRTRVQQFGQDVAIIGYC